MAASTREEKTFRAYTSSDAEKYARHRQQYSDALYQSIYSYHLSTGGKLDTVVDLGCGPGTATLKLAETFNTTIGLDPSEGMISAARALINEKGPNGPVVRFDVSTAENISSELTPDGSVDLITAATCAHWFNLDLFYPTAARILADNGTIALFISRSGLHPDTPNAAAIIAALSEIEAKELHQYYEPGNLLAQDLYAALPLPWTITPPEPAFPKHLFKRKTFGLEAEAAEGQVDGEEFYKGSHLHKDLDTLEMMLGTGSPMARWREANPEKAGTEQDVVKKIRRTIEKFLWEAGVEKGKELVRPGNPGVLLMLKKRA